MPGASPSSRSVAHDHHGHHHTTITTSDPRLIVQNAVPAWGSYLYKTFLLPTSSPNVETEWLNLNLPFGPNAAQSSTDDFSLARNNNAAVPPAASPSAPTVFIKV